MELNLMWIHLQDFVMFWSRGRKLPETNQERRAPTDASAALDSAIVPAADTVSWIATHTQVCLS